MAKVSVFENSKFATVLSFLGYLCMPIGVYCLFEDGLDKSVGIIIIAAGFALKILSILVNRWKEKRLAKRAAKKNQIKSEGVSGASVNSEEKAKARASLDEFVKYKELLSKGTITREEFEAKTGELFKDYVKTK
ncbi:MAG: hypothetical protein IJE65_04455 [Clostridia bacterium]|nr:hypothetical protein [Clostridia bacterium]